MDHPSDPARPQEPSGPTSRRAFLAGGGAVAGGLLLAGATPAAAERRAPAVHTGPRMKDLGEVIERGRAQTQYPPVIRCDVTTYTQGSGALIGLQGAVSMLRGRAASDPTSWAAQADIHRIWCNSPPVAGGYVHYSWRFLVWHRAYLYFNEQILRAAMPSYAVSIPYWNWTVDLKLPWQYWGATNPLNDPTRVMTPTSQLDPAQTAVAGLLALTTFDAFGGTASAAGGLEVGPHNYVHRSVGGDMGAFATAGLDPIFWAHHCNVDRVWWEWLNEGGGRANPVDPAWLTQTYPFYDTAGNTVQISFADAAALPVTYLPPTTVVALAAAPTRLTAPRTHRARLDATAARSVRARADVDDAPPVLRVSGLSVPSEAVTVNVFANRPTATAATPTSDRGFAGSFTLIPSGHDHGGVDLRVPLHRAVPRLLTAAAADPSAGVSLTLVPVGSTGVTYERLELEL